MDALKELFALSHLYLGAGVGYVEDIPPPPPHSTYWRYDAQDVANPLGIAVIGYEWNPSRNVEIRWEFFRHQSYIPVNDRGQNSSQLTIIWRPFK